MPRAATGTVEWRGTPPRWWARVTAKDAEGNPRRVWIDLEREDLKNTPEDRKIAKRLALTRAKAASKKRLVGVEAAAAPKVTLSELEDKWFALLDKAGDLKPATVASYKSCWRANIKDSLGKHTAATATTPVLRAWVREMAEASSPSTVRNNVNALTRFFGDARAERWLPITVNPMRDDDVRAMMPAVEAPDAGEIEHWTPAAFAALLASPKLPVARFGLYLVDVLTGLRDGELHGLQWKHVALDATVPHLRLRQQLGTMRDGEPVTLGAPKTKYSKRDVPLHPAALSWLAWWKVEGWTAYVEIPVEGGGSVRRAPEADDFVFPSPAGRAWRPRGPDVLRDDLADADLPVAYLSPDGERSPFTFHAIRHTFASWLGSNGVDGDLVDRLLGQAPHTVRGRHYQAPDLAQLARAVGTLKLALPDRSGVAYIASAEAEETSRESSRWMRTGAANEAEAEVIQLLRHPSSGVEQRFRKP